MKSTWLAALLAGCAVAAPAAMPPPVCRGTTNPSGLGAIHFLSDQLGVGLTLPSSRCQAILAVTRDGGRHWLSEGTPVSGGPGQEQLVATSTNDVWAVGGGRLMATTNGGSTWTTETPRGRVLALALRRGVLLMLDCVGDSAYGCTSVLMRKALPNGVWTIASPKLAPNPPPELAVAGESTIVVSTAGSLVIVSARGPRFTVSSDPTWMGPPCHAAGFAAAGRTWWLLCLGAAAAGSSEKALLDTTDGGRIWTTASQVTSLAAPPLPGAIPLQEPDAIAAGSPERLWLATQNDLYESNDGGARWTWVRGPDPQGTPASFDVLSPTQAWLLAPGQGLWRTTDGRHWRALGPVVIPQ